MSRSAEAFKNNHACVNWLLALSLILNTIGSYHPGARKDGFPNAKGVVAQQAAGPGKGSNLLEANPSPPNPKARPDLSAVPQPDQETQKNVNEIISQLAAGVAAERAAREAARQSEAAALPPSLFLPLVGFNPVELPSTADELAATLGRYGYIVLVDDLRATPENADGTDQLSTLNEALQTLFDGYQAAKSRVEAHGETFIANPNERSLQVIDPPPGATGGVCMTFMWGFNRVFVIDPGNYSGMEQQIAETCSLAEVYHFFQAISVLFANGSNSITDEGKSNILDVMASIAAMSNRDPQSFRPSQELVNLLLYSIEYQSQGFVPLGFFTLDGDMQISRRLLPLGFSASGAIQLGDQDSYQTRVEEVATLLSIRGINLLRDSTTPIEDMFLFLYFATHGKPIPNWLREEKPEIAEAIQDLFDQRILTEKETLDTFEEFLKTEGNTWTTSVVKLLPGTSTLRIQTQTTRLERDINGEPMKNPVTTIATPASVRVIVDVSNLGLGFDKIQFRPDTRNTSDGTEFSLPTMVSLTYNGHYYIVNLGPQEAMLGVTSAPNGSEQFFYLAPGSAPMARIGIIGIDDTLYSFSPDDAAGAVVASVLDHEELKKLKNTTEADPRVIEEKLNNPPVK